MDTEQIVVPETAQRPRRAYRPRMSKAQRIRQEKLLDVYNLWGEFIPCLDLDAQLAKALHDSRLKRGYIREAVQAIGRLLARK